MYRVIDELDHSTEHPDAGAAIEHARRMVRASPQYWNRAYNALIAGTTVTVAKPPHFITIRPPQP